MLTLSARDNRGLDDLWEKIKECQATLSEAGVLDGRRADQAASWMREIFEQRLLAAFKGGRRAARHYQEHRGQGARRRGQTPPKAPTSSPVWWG